MLAVIAYRNGWRLVLVPAPAQPVAIPDAELEDASAPKIDAQDPEAAMTGVEASVNQDQPDLVTVDTSTPANLRRRVTGLSPPPAYPLLKIMQEAETA